MKQRAYKSMKTKKMPASLAQSDACTTGDQEVAGSIPDGSIPAGSSNILSLRLIVQ